MCRFFFPQNPRPEQIHVRRCHYVAIFTRSLNRKVAYKEFIKYSRFLQCPRPAAHRKVLTFCGESLFVCPRVFLTVSVFPLGEDLQNRGG